MWSIHTGVFLALFLLGCSVSVSISFYIFLFCLSMSKSLPVSLTPGLCLIHFAMPLSDSIPMFFLSLPPLSPISLVFSLVSFPQSISLIKHLFIFCSVVSCFSVGLSICISLSLSLFMSVSVTLSVCLSGSVFLPFTKWNEGRDEVSVENRRAGRQWYHRHLTEFVYSFYTCLS